MVTVGFKGPTFGLVDGPRNISLKFVASLCGKFSGGTGPLKFQLNLVVVLGGSGKRMEPLILPSHDGSHLRFASHCMFVDFANSVVGRVHGGLAHVAVLTGALLASVSGSAVASASAIGSSMVPSLRKYYDDGYSSAVIAAAANLGPIIPPSGAMIMYALMSGGRVSVGGMFMAGVVPGLLLVLGLMGTASYISYRRGVVRAYMDECIEKCRETGYAETILGRRRYINEIHASNFMTRQLGERLAMNTPVHAVDRKSVV